MDERRKRLGNYEGGVIRPEFAFELEREIAALHRIQERDRISIRENEQRAARYENDKLREALEVLLVPHRENNKEGRCSGTYIQTFRFEHAEKALKSSSPPTP